nr:MAG TPA: hypothetical protein [Caudoviricetes sp.]
MAYNGSQVHFRIENHFRNSLCVACAVAYFQEEKELYGYCVSYCNHAAYALFYTCNDARGLHPQSRVVNF